MDISVGDVVRKMEVDMALVECFTDTSRCLLTSSCRLRGVLDQALESFFASLDKVSLAELLGPTQREILHVLKREPTSSVHHQTSTGRRTAHPDNGS